MSHYRPGRVSVAVSRAQLTRRQREILRLTAKGLGNGEIARDLGISPATVRAHLSDAYTRLRVGGRTDAFRALGWLEVPSEVE